MTRDEADVCITFHTRDVYDHTAGGGGGVVGRLIDRYDHFALPIGHPCLWDVIKT